MTEQADAGHETAGTTRERQRKTPHDSMIDHAGRMWDSERENAGRIAERINLVAGAAIALLGLGLFSFGWLYEVPSRPILHPSVTFTIHALLIMVVLLFARALGVLYIGAPSGSATELLELDESDAPDPMKTVAFRRTYRAYLDLKGKNAKERLKLSRGQEAFGWGVGITLLAVLLYLVGSLPAKMDPEVGSHGHASDSKRQSDQSAGIPAGDGSPTSTRIGTGPATGQEDSR